MTKELSQSVVPLTSIVYVADAVKVAEAWAPEVLLSVGEPEGLVIFHLLTVNPVPPPRSDNARVRLRLPADFFSEPGTGATSNAQVRDSPSTRLTT